MVWAFETCLGVTEQCAPNVKPADGSSSDEWSSDDEWDLQMHDVDASSPVGGLESSPVADERVRAPTNAYAAARAERLKEAAAVQRDFARDVEGILATPALHSDAVAHLQRELGRLHVPQRTIHRFVQAGVVNEVVETLHLVLAARSESDAARAALHAEKASVPLVAIPANIQLDGGTPPSNTDRRRGRAVGSMTDRPSPARPTGSSPPKPAAPASSRAAKPTVFSKADIGLNVTIRGDSLLVDGQARCADWGNARHRDVVDLMITDVQERPKGLVTLEDRTTFQNPQPGLEQFTPGGDCLRSRIMSRGF